MTIAAVCEEFYVIYHVKIGFCLQLFCCFKLSCVEPYSNFLNKNVVESILLRLVDAYLQSPVVLLIFKIIIKKSMDIVYYIYNV